MSVGLALGVGDASPKKRNIVLSMFDNTNVQPGHATAVPLEGQTRAAAVLCPKVKVLVLVRLFLILIDSALWCSVPVAKRSDARAFIPLLSPHPSSCLRVYRSTRPCGTDGASGL